MLKGIKVPKWTPPETIEEAINIVKSEEYTFRKEFDYLFRKPPWPFVKATEVLNRYCRYTEVHWANPVLKECADPKSAFRELRQAAKHIRYLNESLRQAWPLSSGGRGADLKKIIEHWEAPLRKEKGWPRWRGGKPPWKSE